MFRAITALFLLFTLADAADAQTLEEIDKRMAAVGEAWAATPLTVRKVFFVAQRPDGFGQYVVRPNNVFKAGEKLVAYAEPVGYGWKDIGGGQYEFGFKVDFLIKTPDGKILTGQQDFADLVEKSLARNLEFMMVLTLDVSGAPAGDYVVEYTLRDRTGPKSTTVSLPFKIGE
jgi:hypothetical protein